VQNTTLAKLAQIITQVINMKTIDDMVYLHEIDEYVTLEEYKDYLNYLQIKYDN